MSGRILGPSKRNKWRHYLDHCNFVIEGTLAFTFDPSDLDSDTEDDSALPQGFEPSQITLCPWFLRWARGKTFKVSRPTMIEYLLRFTDIELQVWDDFSFRAAGAKTFQKLITNVWFAPIDAVSALDKLILHEMTHTMVCADTAQDDVVDVSACLLVDYDQYVNLIQIAMAEGGAPGFGVAYGWKAANTLAQQYTSHQDENRHPIHNADSYALLASGKSPTLCLFNVCL